ncbi:MAG: glycogen debranching protein GlgX [Chloroflexota bacterium]
MTTETETRYTLGEGTAHPLGATPDAEGVNFAVFSRHGTSVELLLFADHDAVEPEATFTLDPAIHKTFHFWHCHVKGARPGQFYAYRVDGPRELSEGHRFDPEKVLIDPYSKGISRALWDRGAACRPGDNLATSMRSAIIDHTDYDWDGDRVLGYPMQDLIIYEMHVGGFTKSPTSGVRDPGTFAGVVEKIPYLQSLGVTAVELLPVMEFDDSEERWVDGRRLTNYWGYSTVNFFAPHSGYCVSPDEAAHITEFRDMVKAFHAAGIEVIMDVVFNHTDEGNHQGPCFSFRGLDNNVYYYLNQADKQFYYDYTGCGNTFNCNHPIGEKLIVDSLKYWVKEMHVDGFRFDEASVLTRDLDGTPLTFPPVVWSIELEEALSDTKVAAEAWDAAGLYQIGHFPGERWAEWNGQYRDTVRRFIKGDAGLIRSLAARVAGSADLYQHKGAQPVNSVNFVTVHDGFTMNDLVSYDAKHNDANGEGNRDGNDTNDSWNHGAEGPTDDPAIEALRDRQVKNFAAILMVSQGVPLFVMGDEVRRTQQGNNNAYCQDNEISWFDWELVERNEGMLRFWQHMIAFRRTHSSLRRPRYFTGQRNERGVKDLEWHGCQLSDPGWDDPGARSLSFTLGGFGHETDIHVMMNMYWEPLAFELPQVDGRRWARSVDTALPSPEDIAQAGAEVLVEGSTYLVSPRSVVVLIGRD